MAYYDSEDDRVDIKVKLGDTVKCMKIYDRPGMDRLRGKIRDSFNIPADADFTLTYADYDGDVVTICDDIDVNRAVGRGRIYVKLSNNKGVNSNAQAGGTTSTQLTSLQVQHPCPNIKTGVISEGLQSVPQQICEALKLHEALLKISDQDIVSKAITGPVLVELADFISKMTQSYLNLDSQTTQSRADSTTQNKKNKNKNKKTTQNVADGSELIPMPYGDGDKSYW
ncbi:hypothetical protein I3842_11G019800 [Carya illinoinensis]|uniref:PB1 domain-containing protein n=1 Tax=Carya illinoinensis TaxID=32201 RepID=A0A922DL60_CARIL|nr:hypothetical protein I3842_11G019800 [Carya illinoinensis]KAG6686439.1 hypothetical protein I3842_11G019800 [Carya illinoinensis]KAG6686440.1 hypothetical protein I3842_11G019800 [Carya illinoinensis]KAG6686441.1 hypothetical protein I3842_11G019800 [Carya illinoinensis]KAG6686442.1 hypothetical protein I3842_11G019800 [Carya illinoinensis]